MNGIPETLNGYPVRAFAYVGARDLVIVERENHPAHKFVAATWDGQTGWHWGHYRDSLEEAKAVYPDAIWRDY